MCSSDLIDWIENILKDYFEKGSAMIAGGARGVDSICATWALHDTKDIDVVIMQADWKSHGNSAGFKRNLQMLDCGDRCLAFWDGKSRGTRHTIDNALDREFTTHVFVWRDKDVSG